VAKRENIRDIALLERIVRFLFHSVGSPISVKKIADTLVSAGRKISVNTVDSYLRALCESYIVYRADRFDIRGREFLKTQSKYYMVDIGFRHLLPSSSSPDLGHLLENIVYLELLRREQQVNVGKMDETEVDFVTTSADETGEGARLAYYQVAASVLDPATMERELAPLRKIRDSYPKYLLTLDDMLPAANINGVRILNVYEWLLGGGV
jgi:predicted AAA+ superfamily ATPase